MKGWPENVMLKDMHILRILKSLADKSAPYEHVLQFTYKEVIGFLRFATGYFE